MPFWWGNFLSYYFILPLPFIPGGAYKFQYTFHSGLSEYHLEFLNYIHTTTCSAHFTVSNSVSTSFLMWCSTCLPGMLPFHHFCHFILSVGVPFPAPFILGSGSSGGLPAFWYHLFWSTISYRPGGGILCSCTTADTTTISYHHWCLPTTVKPTTIQPYHYKCTDGARSPFLSPPLPRWRNRHQVPCSALPLEWHAVPLPRYTGHRFTVPPACRACSAGVTCLRSAVLRAQVPCRLLPRTIPLPATWVHLPATWCVLGAGRMRSLPLPCLGRKTCRIRWSGLRCVLPFLHLGLRNLPPGYLGTPPASPATCRLPSLGARSPGTCRFWVPHRRLECIVPADFCVCRFLWNYCLLGTVSFSGVQIFTDFCTPTCLHFLPPGTCSATCVQWDPPPACTCNLPATCHLPALWYT